MAGERDRLLLQIEGLEQGVLTKRKLQEEQEKKDRTFFVTQAQTRAKAQEELDTLTAEERRLNAERATYIRQQEQSARKWSAATTELQEVQAMGWWQRTFSKWRTYDEEAQAVRIEAHGQDWVAKGQNVAQVDAALTINRSQQKQPKDTVARSEQEERERRDSIKRFPSPYGKKIKQLEQQLTQLREALWFHVRASIW